MAKGIIKLKNAPAILCAASVVGKHESDGPLGALFDFHDKDDRFGQSTWEKAEAEMQHMALNLAMSKNKISITDIDAIFAGDLMNQCISSTYGLIAHDAPFMGLYSACSTAAEALILSGMTVNAGYFKRTASVTSSHNCSAERQFRTPVEYGGQRTPTSQWTVTGSAAFIIADDEGRHPRITEVMLGMTVDYGITDANNMGAAMAPAAADTMIRYFESSGLGPSAFDLIVTGDLGFEGHSIVLDLMSTKGYDLSGNYNDCGLLIYNRSSQDMHAGGSGCGCSAVVLASYLLKLIRDGELRDVLFIGTGALMSPLSVQQGGSIPGIAHLVRIKGDA
ncbi:MAG: stage V sporulation protein AD [Eubacteriales bacterium]|nr:stage V sporulation protein AD [Eubacteriales bacterium]